MCDDTNHPRGCRLGTVNRDTFNIQRLRLRIAEKMRDEAKAAGEITRYEELCREVRTARNRVQQALGEV